MTTSRFRPRIALTFGDPAGIGPEVARAALSDPALRERVRFVAIGPARERPSDLREWTRGDAADLEGDEHLFLATWGPGHHALGRSQAECGRAALAALRAGHELASSGAVDALVTAPVAKEALALAGERVEGQTELLARWSDAPRTQMLAIAGGLRVLLLTRHLPLRDALARITKDAVVAHLAQLDEGLRGLGIERPRLALAGLNPHAGEGGLLGREELDILHPAAEQARGLGLDVAGPLSPDTVFVHASRGVYDGVLALYHDQAFIPVKLLDPEGGVTVLLGLPYLRMSPAHGTAFDIAGQGRASPASLVTAVHRACDWVLLRQGAGPRPVRPA